MEQRNLEKALDVYSALITGQEISRSNPDTRDLYEEFYANAAVYDIVTKMMKKLNLNLYEYQDAVYLTAGEGNRVFGYTNDDMKRLLGLRLNRIFYHVQFPVTVLSGFRIISGEGICAARRYFRAGNNVSCVNYKGSVCVFHE